MLLHVATAGEWRDWLKANHAVEKQVWLVISKKHAKRRTVTLTEATEEALCFGWIDSVLKPLDDERYALRYTPRKKGSEWSEVNKRRVAKLIEEGRMTDAGLAKIEEAKRTGEWDRLARRGSKHG